MRIVIRSFCRTAMKGLLRSTGGVSVSFSVLFGGDVGVSIPPGTVVASRDFSGPSPSQGMSCKPNVVSRFSSPSVCKTRRPCLVFQVSCVGICWTILAPESRSAVWLMDIDIN